METGPPRVQPMKFRPRGICRSLINHPAKVVSFCVFTLAAYSTFIMDFGHHKPADKNLTLLLLNSVRQQSTAEPYFTSDDPDGMEHMDYVSGDDQGVGGARRGGEKVADLNSIGRASMRVLQDAFLQEGPSKSVYHNLLEVKPPPYLSNYKAPCWVEILDTSTPYNKSQFYKLDTYHPTMRYMEAVFRVRMSRGERWRLRCLPYFYIAGLAKCGTSELYTRLCMHPNITQGPMKEPHYWTRYRMGWMPKGYMPIRDYADMYDYAAQEIQERAIQLPNGSSYHPMFFGDGSVSTLLENDYFRKVAENFPNEGIPLYFTPHYIHHVTPQARIIVIFRNPADRLYSDYLFFSTLKKNLHTPPSPENFHRRVTDGIYIMNQCIEERGSVEKCVYDLRLKEEMMNLNLRTGMYSVYVRHWLDVWPRDQLLFLRVEDLKEEGRINALNRVLHFLGENDLPEYAVKELEHDGLRNTRPKELKQVGPMLNITRKVLEKFYEKYNRQLADMLHDKKYLWH